MSLKKSSPSGGTHPGWSDVRRWMRGGRGGANLAVGWGQAVGTQQHSCQPALGSRERLASRCVCRLFVVCYFPFNAFVLKQIHQSSGPCRLCLLGMVESGIALERSVLFVYQDGQSLLSLLAPSSSGSCLEAASPPSRSALPPFPSSTGFLLWAGHAGLPGTQQSCSLWGQEDFVPQQE